MGFKEQLDINKLPQHIAVIMDGNGRWAKNQGKIRHFGHESGVLSVKDIVEGCADIGIKYLRCMHFQLRTGTGLRKKSTL
jgi:undecaprenyl diphosphate synthase